VLIVLHRFKTLLVNDKINDEPCEGGNSCLSG